jgi:Tol biopolymer transport system component
LLYLARVYKNLNKATQQVTKKKKFKNVLADFMTYEMEKYEKDISRRKNYPKGSEITSVTVGKRVDYFHFNVNPNKRNGSFAVVQYKKGQYRLLLNEEDKDKTLLKFGAKSKIDEINPNYPMMAWDPKGSRLSVLYEEEGRIKLFVYDVITRVKPYKRDLTDIFDQVQDMKYMINSQTLLFSAVKNGHSDIYTYDIENDKAKQVTNDVFDDLDPSFVSFPNKTGIIFSSNRPSQSARGSDTSLLKNNYNIFLITDFTTNRPELNQVSQLTNLKFGNARYPMQYNTNHFTFVSDEYGVGNRYAGFFTSQKEGLDTLVLVGEDILRNPSLKEVDSLLKAYHKDDVDSVAVVSVYSDSA